MRWKNWPFAIAFSFALLLPSASIHAQKPASKTDATKVSPPKDGDSVPVSGLPNKDGSFKFLVLGDFGTGASTQYQLAEQMAKLREKFKFEIVTMVGDNLYGSERPQDFTEKFEKPYKALLDNGVKFYASLGNHDSREQRYYKLFNMDGKLYYSYSPKPEIRFFFLESTYMDPEQVKWVEGELKGSEAKWKIPVFHHPLYSSAKRHGSEKRVREVLEPFFIKHNVSVVLNGHDHVYERVKPQSGIHYFVVGSGGKLRSGNLAKGSALTAKGFDTDLVFLAAEIDGDEMHYSAISRTGEVVDSGVITRRTESAASPKEDQTPPGTGRSVVKNPGASKRSDL